MYKRVYIEITNICNLSCSFCPGTKRSQHFMTVDEFRTVAEKVRPHTDYIYLHVMGEPLLHPRLAEILSVASGLGFRINITTNGTLIDRYGALLLSTPAIRKVSFSLHSFEGNGKRDPFEYLEKIWNFCEKSECITALRLWNDGGADRLNRTIFEFLSQKTGLDVESLPFNANGRRLSKHVYLESAAIFDWPDTNGSERNVRFCHGLTGQFAVLCDGTVVPCCLDSEGTAALGNIFTQNIDEILSSERACRLRRSFTDHRPSEALCRHCGYAEKF